MQAIVRRHSTALALFALAALGFIAYANGLSNSFHFDDYEGILNNSALHDLRNIPAYFTAPVIFRLTSQVDWRPILQITYALDYAIGGADAMVFHATELLIHVAAAWMIFFIVGEILKRTEGRAVSASSFPVVWIAPAAAMLFVVHTVNTQTVDYSWARSSALAALFYLLAFYCHLRGPFRLGAPGSAWWHAGALGAFALGLGTKATVVSLPGMLLAYEALLLNPDGRNPVSLYRKEPRRLLKHLPTLAVLFVYVILRAALTPRVTGQLISNPWMSRKTYLLTQFRAWIYYLKLYIWPDPLILDYPGFGWSKSFWETGVIVSLALIAALIVAAWAVRRRDPLLTFFTAWFFIALLPEASIIVRPDAVTGHRPYLAYAGLSVAAVLFVLTGAHALSRKWSSTVWLGRRLPAACGVLFAAVVIALTAATMRRNRVWRDDVTLWSDVIAKDSSNVRAYMVLGVQYMDRNQYAEARAMLDKAVELDPKRSEAYLYLGRLNKMLGNYEAALSDLNRVVNGNRLPAFGLVYRGDVYREMGRYDEALSDYQAAVKRNLNFAEAYYGMAIAYWKKNALPEAAAACRKLMELEPKNRRSYQCLGSLLMHQQLFAQALKIYYAGVTRFPQNPTLWYGLGTAYEELGRYNEAEEAYSKSAALGQAASETK